MYCVMDIGYSLMGLFQALKKVVGRNCNDMDIVALVLWLQWRGISSTEYKAAVALEYFVYHCPLVDVVALMDYAQNNAMFWGHELKDHLFCAVAWAELSKQVLGKYHFESR